MKKGILALLAIMLIVTVTVPTAKAQGFSALLDKIDVLEARLDSVRNQMAGVNKKAPDLSSYESRLSGIEQELNLLKGNQDLDFIENSIVELSLKVKQLENSGDVNAGSSNQDAERLHNLTLVLRAALAEAETGQGNEIENHYVSAMAEDGNSAEDQGLRDEVGSLRAELNTFLAEREAEPQMALGEESEGSISLSNIDLTGFFDLVYLNPQNSEEDKGFAINQMEVDIESKFSPYLTIAGAIAYGDEAFEIGAAYADLHWMGEIESHPIHSQIFDHSGLLIGQFDVPFGADFEKIASPDRPLVTSPLAVTETVDGWNDVGLNLYGGQELWEAQTYFVNGDQDNMAYGGRLMFMVSEFLRIGGSSASILNSEDQPQANFFGGDAVFSYEPIEIMGEYILKQDDLQADQINISGYYVEGKIGLATWLNKDFYFIGGYSAVEHKDVVASQITAKLNRATLGAGFNINNNASMRFEYLINGGDDIEDANLAVGQFVVSF